MHMSTLLSSLLRSLLPAGSAALLLLLLYRRESWQALQARAADDAVHGICHICTTLPPHHLRRPRHRLLGQRRSRLRCPRLQPISPPLPSPPLAQPIAAVHLRPPWASPSLPPHPTHRPFVPYFSTRWRTLTSACSLRRGLKEHQRLALRPWPHARERAHALVSSRSCALTGHGIDGACSA
jgi:hypothetical protein